MSPLKILHLQALGLIFGLVLAFGLQGQGLLDELDALNGLEDSTPEFVRATFKDTRIVNAQSNETPGAGVLHFVIAHRFGAINEGPYSLWGLDNASMRMAFDYGLNDRLALSLARSTYRKTLEGSVKARLLRQRESGGSPVAVTWFSGMMVNGLRWADPERDNLFSSRIAYVHMCVVARKFSERLSLALTPALTHRNLVSTNAEPHDILTFGIGGRFKISHRVSLNGECHPFLSERPSEASTSLSLGVDIETGGHVFQLHLTNAPGMFEQAYLTEATGNWADGTLYFGFNLSRVFQLTERKT
jgi:hypothetical protein